MNLNDFESLGNPIGMFHRLPIALTYNFVMRSVVQRTKIFVEIIDNAAFG
jgi:hypothetical protein